MQDNARSHRANLVPEFLKNEVIRWMNLPASFLALNLTEIGRKSMEMRNAAQPPTENHLGTENCVADCVRPIAT